ncbi:hypothetical protein Tco_0872540 [Tanacetum coccineum]
MTGISVYDEYEHFVKSKEKAFQGYYVRRRRYISEVKLTEEPSLVHGRKVVVQEPWRIYNATNQRKTFQVKQCERNGVAGNVGQSDFRFNKYFKDKMLLMASPGSMSVLDEEQSCFFAGEQVTNVDDDVDDFTRYGFGTQCGSHFLKL